MDFDFPLLEKLFLFSAACNFQICYNVDCEISIWSAPASRLSGGFPLLKQATGYCCYVVKNYIKAKLEGKTTEPGI